MKREIFIDSFLGENRMAVMEDGILKEYVVEHDDCRQINGNIYKGIVRDVLGGMQAAFMNIGLEKNGYLALEDISVSKGEIGEDLKREMRAYSARIKRGQELIVQVTKESYGEKGPRLTCNITFPGVQMVFLPTLNYIGISRKITERKERDRLTAIARRIKPEGTGLIMRTASYGKTEEELQAELDLLNARWQDIASHAAYRKAPSLLYSENSLSARAIRDFAADTQTIWFDDKEEYDKAVTLAAELQVAPEIRLYEAEQEPLFAAKGIERQIAQAFARKIALVGGGSIVIDYTEAMTVIDVNTGSCVGGESLEDNITRTNCEAAEEIARQLRLRDIGGIIVIDFIDMANPLNAKKVMDCFKSALRHDRAATHVSFFSEFGLVEMTRKRFRQGIYRLGSEECDKCGGTGWRLSAESAAREALRKLTARWNKGESSLFLIAASEPVMGKIRDMGTVFRGSAFVFHDKTRSGAEYSISPCAASELPRNAIRIGKELSEND